MTIQEMGEGVKYCHEQDKKAYLTMNIFAHNEDISELQIYVEKIRDIPFDAFIVSDPGVMMTLKDAFPEAEFHLSTQANLTNYQTALFWYRQGVRRIVLARELTFPEIHEIRNSIPPDMEIEAFVQGAMCISYSGRCLLSNFMIERDANRGACAHPCRWKYSLVEEKRPGQYFPVEEDERGTYILNSRDLCLLGQLPELAAAGVQSFKIEGRMKSVHYLATVVRVYREALDALASSKSDQTQTRPEWLEEIEKAGSRGYTTGFYSGQLADDSQEYETVRTLPEWEYAGLVKGWNALDGMALVEQRNHMQLGDEIEVLRPAGAVTRQRLALMTDVEGTPLTTAPHPQQMLLVQLDAPAGEFAMLRRRRRE